MRDRVEVYRSIHIIAQLRMQKCDFSKICTANFAVFVAQTTLQQRVPFLKIEAKSDIGFTSMEVLFQLVFANSQYRLGGSHRLGCIVGEP